jgi:hypothetical protein
VSIGAGTGKHFHGLYDAVRSARDVSSEHLCGPAAGILAAVSEEAAPAGADYRGGRAVIVGGYTLDLYCDDPRHTANYRMSIGRPGDLSLDAEFTGETYGECARQARRKGWMLSRDGTRCLCPGHSRKRKKAAALCRNEGTAAYAAILITTEGGK